MSWLGDSLGGGYIGGGVQWVVDNGLYNTEKNWSSGENLLNIGFLGVSGLVGAFTGGTGGAALLGGRIALGATIKGTAKGLLRNGVLASSPLAGGTALLGRKLFTRGATEAAEVGIRRGATEAVETATRRQSTWLGRQFEKAYTVPQKGSVHFDQAGNRVTAQLAYTSQETIVGRTFSKSRLAKSIVPLTVGGLATRGTIMGYAGDKVDLVSPFATAADIDPATGLARTTTADTPARPTTGLTSLFNVPAGLAEKAIDFLDDYIGADMAKMIVGLATFGAMALSGQVIGSMTGADKLPGAPLAIFGAAAAAAYGIIDATNTQDINWRKPGSFTGDALEIYDRNLNPTAPGNM